MSTPNSRPTVAYPDGVDNARTAPSRVAALAGITEPVDVVMGWTPERRPWLDDADLRGTTFMAGYELSAAVADGRIRYRPVRLSAIPRALADAPPPAVTVVTGVRRGNEVAFLGTVGWGPTAARLAGAVVVEVDELAPDLGGPLIPGEIAAIVPRPQPSGPVPVPRGPDAVELAVGRNVASILPADPTLQLGPGGIAEAIIASIDRPVRIWSGLVTDAMARLAERGMLIGPITAGYVWGGGPVQALAAAGRLQLLPVEETHDLSVVSSIPRFVGCNTALQVGLDGAVNVERAGRRFVAGIGGHPDFCTAASRSPGGLSVIALRSVTGRGGSTIVPRVETVSTPRCDVDVVVTEHGIADLRGLDDAERAERMLTIAAPEHRGALAALDPSPPPARSASHPGNQEVS